MNPDLPSPWEVEFLTTTSHVITTARIGPGFHSDGRFLCVKSVWDPSSGELVFGPDSLHDHSLSLSQGGDLQNLVLVPRYGGGGMKSFLKIWNIQANRVLKILPLATTWTIYNSWFNDRFFIALVHHDSGEFSIEIWNLEVD